MKKYYKQKQIIAKIDKSGKIIGEIEKWEAHKKGVLHKGFTIALVYKNQFVIQRRRHPAFDGVLDITSSSHQIYVENNLQTLNEAIYECLKREWNLGKNDLGQLENLGAVYYKARDPKSIYTEHEMCEILVMELKVEPKPNYDFAYDFSLVDKQELANKNSRIYENLAPWVKKIIEENKL